MDGFDPDKYLKETEPQAFDPDKYLAETKPVSEIESAARGTAQGVTLGHADEIAGAAGALWDIATKGKSIDDIKTLYKKHRDESRANFKHAKKVNPNSYLAGEIGGGVATALVPVGGAATLGRAAIMGAGMGGAAGMGASEGEGWDENAKDLLVGSALGAGAGVAGKYIADKIPVIANKAGQKLSSFAEKRAFKAMGPTKKVSENAIKRGQDQAIGRDLLDSGVIFPGRSKEKMLEKVAGLTDDSVNQLDETLTKASNAQAKASDANWIKLEESKFSPKEAAAALKQKIREEYSELPEEVIGPRLKQVDTWFSRDGRMNIKEAQKFKTQMQKFIKDGSYLKENPGASQETLLGVRKGIKEGIEKNADVAAEVLGQQGGQIKQINKTLGGRLQAEDILSDRVARDATNRTVSLTDYIAMVPAAVANPITAAGAVKTAAVGLGNKLIREQGSATAAYATDKIAKVLLRSPKIQALANANPNIFRAVSAGISRHLPSDAPAKVLSADNKEASLKGEPRWMLDGFEKLNAHDKAIVGDEKAVERMFASPEGKRLLIAASDLKPGSKAMAALVEKFKAKSAKGGS